MKRSIRFLLIFCAAMLPIVTLFSHRTDVSMGVAESFATETQAEVSDPPRVTRFLVMGVDRAARLTDSIFLVALNETENNARILQIPRDTYANYTDRDYKKINGALQQLGEVGVKELLSQALGVKIHYFVTLDLSALSSIVDAIGGVEVDVPQDMTYSDPAQGLEIRLSKGLNRLDGRGAEHFVRYRSGYVNADLGRLDAQKLFLQAFAKKCCSLTATQMLHVTCLALTRLQTDIGLPEAIRTVSALRSCDTDNIPMATLAGQAVQGTSGAWYYAVNREGAQMQVKEYLFPEQPTDNTKFDPNGLFDRTENDEFHKIYQSPYGDLPLNPTQKKG